MLHAAYVIPLRPPPRRQLSWFRPRPGSHLQAAPGDVLLEIAAHVDALADLCSLALTVSPAPRLGPGYACSRRSIIADPTPIERTTTTNTHTPSCGFGWLA
jgi:hypothetical protein